MVQKIVRRPNAGDCKPKGQSGFTITELAVVLGVLGIGMMLLAIYGPPMQKDSNFRSGLSTLRSALTVVRGQATARQQTAPNRLKLSFFPTGRGQTTSVQYPAGGTDKNTVGFYYDPTVYQVKAWVKRNAGADPEWVDAASPPMPLTRVNLEFASRGFPVDATEVTRDKSFGTTLVVRTLQGDSELLDDKERAERKSWCARIYVNGLGAVSGGPCEDVDVQ